MVTTVRNQGPKQGQSGLVKTFDSLNPATSEPIGTYPIFEEHDVAETVARAREAAKWWSGLPAKERQAKLLAWKSYLTRYIMRLAELVHAETGKPVADAQLEILLAVVHIDWAAKNARKVLGSHKVKPGLVAINQAASVEYQPLGVVGVIGPWNYPVFTPMGSIAYALAAGNSVVFKPSEFTPGVGGWLVSSFNEIVPEYPVLQLVTGLGETGSHLARSGVDKIAFTGSTKTAKKVMAACAENLTPMVAECGGKDALLVSADADLDAAADAAVWGALSNAGQTCIGVERIYVAQDIYHTFVEKLAERVATLRPGDDREADYGPMTMPGQLEVIEQHIADAMACGGRAVVGGLGSIRKPYVGPVILADVPESSTAVTDETFGPTMTVTPVANLDEGVRLANGGRYGLGGSVFAKNKRDAMKAARALRSGMTSINSVIAYASVPSLPFGGSGESGFGRIHGADGLREFSRAKAITRQRMKPMVNVTSFSRSDADLKKLMTLATLLHGKPPRYQPPSKKR
ncbi:MAG TPA: aldehyde dehydrogenase family protein [Streptosporangiaceae bacterium]|nr:aldehyde dehydrogenase family protein [Streptosporangiaceae bacterium]